MEMEEIAPPPLRPRARRIQALEGQDRVRDRDRG